MRPETTAERHDIPLADGGRLALWRWPRPCAARVVFSHGVGLASGAYGHFLALMARRWEVIAFDLRGHGGSVGAPLPASGLLDRMTTDMEEVWHGIGQRFGDVPAAGVFHSIAGVLALRQIVRHGARWGALALLDPALTPTETHALMPLKRKATEVMVRRTVMRRSRFPDIAAYAAELARRPEFAGWHEGAHAMLAAATLRDDPATGEAVLRVLPATEARLYRENVLPDLATSLAGLPVPVRLICSDPEAPHASPIPTLCRAIAEGAGLGFETVRGTTHMLPLEKPEACVDAVGAFLAEHGFAAVAEGPDEQAP